MMAIRGAITVDRDTPEAIREAVLTLYDRMLVVNGLQAQDIQTILFSATKDLRSAYPGKYLREERGLTETALLHFQEMDVEGAMPKCLRLLLQCPGNAKGKPVYLRDAKRLRPDLG